MTDYVPTMLDDARERLLSGYHDPQTRQAVADDWDAELAAHDAEQRRLGAVEAWDEACHAFAWCLDNGPPGDAVEYVRTHLPEHLRADRLEREGGE